MGKKFISILLKFLIYSLWFGLLYVNYKDFIKDAHNTLIFSFFCIMWSFLTILAFLLSNFFIKNHLIKWLLPKPIFKQIEELITNKFVNLK